MTHIANKGNHKFDHLVGGYPAYEPPVARPIQFIDPAFVLPPRPDAAFLPVPTPLVVWDEYSFSRYLREALSLADDRTRGLVLPPETLGETDGEVRRLLAALVRSSHDTWGDASTIPAGTIKANLEARTLRSR